MNVPVNRLEQEAQFSLGRTSEITRDEVKFKKFIDRLRSRFSHLFVQLLKTQLLLKGVITKDDWNTWKETIAFDFIEDNYFSELKQSEMIKDRYDMLSSLDEYIGKFISNEWVRKNILRFNDDEIEQIAKQIDAEDKDGENDMPDPDDPRYG